MANNNALLLLVLFILNLYAQSTYANFVAFESGQVRPLALSPDNSRLFVVNTPDNTLEIFNINNGNPTYAASVSVGMEPVAVAARNNNEVWVVNYLSDSISIVDVSSSPARVIRTLLVGDEPADIVFADTDGERAFITTAHRGQNTPFNSATNPGELTTPGIGRADVWVFDANNLGATLEGTPLTIITLFGDTPKALAVTPDGKTVYAAVFKSGNQTTSLHEQIVCNGGPTASACSPDTGEPNAVGGLPGPYGLTIGGLTQPEVGLIVKYDGARWADELGRDWSNMVRFNLPDKDVFVIDADAPIPVETTVSYQGVGTVLFNMAVNPVSGKVYVANTDAINEVRFEGPGLASSTVQGHLHEARITVIDPAAPSVSPRHLNKHINYSVTPAPAGVSDDSLATPKGIAVTSDGSTLYIVAKSSGKVGVFDTAELEADTFVPDSNDHISLSAGGPDGLVLDEINNRLYVTTRFDNAISVIDTVTKTEIYHIALHNPEPPSIITGRQFLYDANLTSSNGEASCASCHIEGDKDELAWDLGNPDGTALNNPSTFTVGPSGNPDFHPMKGPMLTQTLRGMDTHGPMHWRGDRTAGNDAGGDPLDEDGAFKKFNGAFVGLLGRTTELTPAEMQSYTDFVLQITPPPNPIRALDDSLTPDQAAGRTFYFNNISDIVTTCNGCHVLAPPTFFGANGNSSFEAETQQLKIPQLRNMYEKVGMFGMPNVPFFNAGDNGNKGDQIRGFGFTHDGSVDSLLRFLNASLFSFSGDVQRKQVEQFLFAFDSNLKPVVGQQVTLTNTNSGVADSRIDLLIARAASGDADLIVKYTQAGEKRGAHRLSSGNFKTDKAAESTLTGSQLRSIAKTAGQEVTYTAVPLGSGQRLGIDRDEDTVLDNDDNCPANANPGQEDDDANGVGNICEPPDFDGDGIEDALDNCPLDDNASQLDTDSDGAGDTCDLDDDNDGLTDVFELIIGTDTLLTDTDGDGFGDAIELSADSNPLDAQSVPANGDINDDGSVNVVDLLLATQIALGIKTPTANEMLRGDVAPLTGGVPDPNGEFNAGDLSLIQQKVFGSVSF